MQGTLNEIDIRSILQLIELGQRTGELFIEVCPPAMGQGSSPPDSKDYWVVFFVNGQIIYAADKHHGYLKRLRDYLQRFQLKEKIPAIIDPPLATFHTPEYACLWQLLAKNSLTPHQARLTVQSMVQEVLFDLLSLRQGNFIFTLGTALDPPLTAFEISPLLLQASKQLQEWKQFHPWLQSPDQLLIITNSVGLQTTLSPHLYQQILTWVTAKTSLRQLARYLHRDLPTVVRGLLPYIETGLLSFEQLPLPSSPAPSPWDTYPADLAPTVVYIDDDLTIGKYVEDVLARRGYAVSLLTDPLEALGQVFYLQPSLIFCDISMPKLDGYEICAMLRQASAFRQIPIIMLTGKETFMDRVRARLVGATDYLTKPFGEGELLLLLESYLPKPVTAKEMMG